MRSRAFRRFQKKRKYNKYKKVLIQQEDTLRPEHRSSSKDLQKRIDKMVETPKRPCQCCRNPRKSVLYKQGAKLTMQERRAGEQAQSELEEIEYVNDTILVE